jgi:hypothetical protein
MPTLGQQLVQSPAFSLDLHGRDPVVFVREVEDGAVRIVGGMRQGRRVCGVGISEGPMFA